MKPDIWTGKNRDMEQTRLKGRKNTGLPPKHMDKDKLDKDRLGTISSKSMSMSAAGTSHQASERPLKSKKSSKSRMVNNLGNMFN